MEEPELVKFLRKHIQNDNEVKEMRVINDDSNWCFVLPDFENLQVSPSVWTDDGDTDIDAIYEQLMEQLNRLQ